MTTGDIPISSGAAYATYEEWEQEYGFDETDLSEDEFGTLMKKAMFELRRQAFLQIREERLIIRSDKKAFLPRKWVADANMDQSITKDDILVYRLQTDGLTLEEVDTADINSIDAFNNYIEFDAGYTPTKQHYVTYYACNVELSQGLANEFKRAVMLHVLIEMFKRLQRTRNVDGVISWSAQGKTVTRDEDQVKQRIEELQREYDALIALLRPLSMRRVRTGGGGMRRGYDPKVAYSDQMFLNNRRRRLW